MAREYADWKFFNQHVQQGLTEGKYLNAAFTLIASGPARLAAGGAGTTTDLLYPIGVVQSFNLGQQSNVMRIFEIGSERSYFIRGRTVGNLALGRIMYHGPSLLRALKAHIGKDSSFISADAVPTDVSGKAFSDLANSQSGTAVETNLTGDGGIKDRYRVAPGDPEGNIWLNLGSDLFNHPIGLAVVLKDSNADTVGAFYFENCHINNHGFATDAGGTILTENAAITFERMLPIDLTNVNLIHEDHIGASGAEGAEDASGSGS